MVDNDSNSSRSEETQKEGAEPIVSRIVSSDGSPLLVFLFEAVGEKMQHNVLARNVSHLILHISKPPVPVRARRNGRVIDGRKSTL